MAEMMPEFFVGREGQLALVGDLLGAPWGTRRVLLVHGPGGIGKTQLLQEIRKRREEYTRLPGGPFVLTEIIDFDDISLRLTLNVGQRIVEELGKEWFGDYLTARDTYVRFQFLEADPETLRAQLQRADRLFLECYNQLAEQKRILLLCDTVEGIQGTDVWRYLLGMAGQLNNTVLILAGRRLDEARSELEGLWGKKVVHFEELSPFAEEEAADYFARTDVGVGLDPEMRDKLYLLTAGHPILIALVIEWLRRDMPLDDITSRPLAELQALDEQTLKHKQEEFEAILVNKILELTIVDQALLRMAHVYLRFDDGILQYLLGLSEAETREMSVELRDFPFVKPRPREAYTLHDEMRRLVTKHCWPRVDPHETQRLDLSRRMVEYYNDLLGGKNEDLRKLREQWKVARQEKDTTLGQEFFRQLAELERQVSVLEVERFHYLLDADPHRAYDYFLEAFDEATLRYRYNFRELLWTEMQPHESEYAGEQRYQIGIRGVKYLLDETQYDQSYQRAEALLGAYGDQSPAWRVDTLVQMANAAARKGETEKALSHFQEALQVCEQHQLDDWLGRVESGLGWIYRLMSKWTEAERIYERALEHSSEAGDLERVAQVLNNLGYVRHLRGNSPGGLTLCEQALEIWRQLRRPRAEASTLSTIGNIWSKLGNYSEAMESYEDALRIFRDQEDWEWIATMYHQMAFAQWLQGDRLEEAQQYAEESVSYCRQYGVEKELFTALHRLGHIYMSRGELQKAQECFEESYQISQKMRDEYRLRDNLLGLAEIAYQKHDYEEAERYVRQALEGIKPEEWISPFLIGGMYRLLGDVFFARREYDKALGEYCRAYPKIAREETFTPYRLSKTLESLEKKIGSLPAELAEQWCDDLRKCWEEQVQEDIGRTELLSFCLVQKVRATKRKAREVNA